MDVFIPKESSFDEIHKRAKDLVYTETGVIRIQCDFDFFVK